MWDGLKTIAVAGVVIVGGLAVVVAANAGTEAAPPAPLTASQQSWLDDVCHTNEPVGDTNVLYPARYPAEWTHCLSVMADDARDAR